MFIKQYRLANNILSNFFQAMYLPMFCIPWLFFFYGSSYPIVLPSISTIVIYTGPDIISYNEHRIGPIRVDNI